MRSPTEKGATMTTRKKKPAAKPAAEAAAAEKPARGTYAVEPQDPPGADVATGRSVVPPRDRTVEAG